MAKKTARQIAESEIKQELLKEGKCFVAFGTFVSNQKMLEIINQALKEQKTERKHNFNLSTWTKSIKFEYDGDYYYIDRVNGISRVHPFNGGIVSSEVLFEEETNPDKCMEDFIQYMDNLSIAMDEMGGDWEG